MSTADLAIAAMALTSLASTGALVYTVRRVSPWPKPPAVPGQAGGGSPSRARNGGTGQDGSQVPAVNGTEPARSTP